ncbi:MAG: carboxylate-amine ligase [Gammaproteobacteria bacterium]
MISVIASPLSLFAGYGIELEYMIVDRASLDVLPIADKLIHAVAGDYRSELKQGELAWSNELVLHVIEIKTNGPAGALQPVPALFHRDITRINELLAPHEACLMPGAVHPWMDPRSDTRLWPHEYNPVYETYDRIFGCQGHGWSNLQSVHLNLPFAGDAEFARLHAAIRVLLPVLPALAASSPIVEGQFTGMLDYRLEAYRLNARKIPSITGRVIPETVSSRGDYEAVILGPMYRDIAPFDPECILRHEWLNSRGAIARFDRSAIEIRVLDVQECPLADLAVLAAIVSALQRLAAGGWGDLKAQQTLTTEELETILLETARSGEQAVIDNTRFLRVLEFPERRCEARDLWHHLIEAAPAGEIWRAPLRTILRSGPLARRLLRAAGKDPKRAHLIAVYVELCRCLAEGRQFLGID